MQAFSVILLALVALAGCGPDPASRSAAVPAAAPAAAPDPLTTQLRTLGQGFDGVAGIAVRDVATGWTTGYRAEAMHPQQSVAKLWVALAVLDAADQGRLTLADPVTVRRGDLSLFHQPIRRFVTQTGAHETTVAELLKGALAQSDNAANQVLAERVGGPEAVQKVIDAKGLGAIRFGPGERLLQTRIAGVPEWRPEFSFGKMFWRARAFVPKPVRAKAMADYLADPMDGATPAAIVAALARLQRGELLSPASTRQFLSDMTASQTGPKRLRDGLKPGWTIAHKTGTGQVLDSLSTGYNDVAILTAPDGRAYAVAVMIASTERPIPERQALMADVARAVVAHHETRHGPQEPGSPEVAVGVDRPAAPD